MYQTREARPLQKAMPILPLSWAPVTATTRMSPLPPSGHQPNLTHRVTLRSHRQFPRLPHPHITTCSLMIRHHNTSHKLSLSWYPLPPAHPADDKPPMEKIGMLILASEH